MYKTCSGAGQTQLTLGFSRKLEHLFLGFGLKASVCMMSQSHPALGFKELLLLEQLLVPRMCVLSAEQVIWVMQVCSPPDRAGVSEHYQALATDLC